MRLATNIMHIRLILKNKRDAQQNGRETATLLRLSLFQGTEVYKSQNLCIGDGVFTTTPYFLVDCGAGEVQDDIYGNKGGDGRGGYTNFRISKDGLMFGGY